MSVALETTLEHLIPHLNSALASTDKSSYDDLSVLASALFRCGIKCSSVVSSATDMASFPPLSGVVESVSLKPAHHMRFISRN